MYLIAILRVAALLGSASAYTLTLSDCPKQRITSFGASGAWWPNDLILFPRDVQENLSSLLFSEDGLRLSSYRYNVGGDGRNDAQIVNTWESRVESFLLTNGSYDWSRDHAGVTFLQAAQRYQVPYITFFINAAPAAIVYNKAACGWDLAASAIQAFSGYIATVLSYWIDHGISIKYISPINEPDNNRSACTQEGMSVAPSIRSTLFSTLRQTLNNSTSAHAVDIIGDETSQIVQADSEYATWLHGSAEYLSHIAIHNYDYPSDDNLTAWYSLTQNLTAAQPPPVKFTETCCSTNSGSGSSVFGAQYDPTMANALIVARYVWQFLTIAQGVSFDWWTAVTYLPCSPTLDGWQCATSINETAGYNSGLIYIDPEYNSTQDFTLYLTKRFWMMRHFSNFVRPDSVRYEVESNLPAGVESLVFETAQGWDLVFLNNQTSTTDVDFRVPVNLFGPSPNVSAMVVTDPENDWSKIQDPPSFQCNNASGPALSLALASQSITSIQVEG